MKIVDQYSDVAFATLSRQLTRMPALESFVKEASLDVAEAEHLPDTAFAWPEERKFPVHSPEHAALSFAYAKQASEVPAHVQASLGAALQVYGISEDVFAEEKVAAAVDDAVYILPQQQLFRVKSAADVREAAQRLLEDFTKLDLEHRATACANLVKQAEIHGVDLPPPILKLSGFVVSSSKIARDWLYARAGAVSEERFKVAYTKIAEALEKEPAEVRDRAATLKLASVVGELDEQSGLDRYYDRKLPDALQTFFNTDKLAAATVDLGGTMYPIQKLAALPASFWGDLGGQELADEVAPGGVLDLQKLATIVETLPLDLKLILKSQLR
jgi:hypothetical protein